jgi:hypothetical protein
MHTGFSSDGGFRLTRYIEDGHLEIDNNAATADSGMAALD